MKKTILLLLITTLLISCGNTKPDQVAKNSDDNLVCTSKRSLGSNMSKKSCRTSAEQKEERQKSKEARSNASSRSSSTN